MDSFFKKQLIRSWRKQTISHVYTLIYNGQYGLASSGPLIPYAEFVEEMKNEHEAAFFDFISSIQDSYSNRSDLMDHMTTLINKCENIRFMELFCNAHSANARTFLTQCYMENEKKSMMKTIEENTATINRLKKEKKELEIKLKEKEWSCEKIFCYWMM